MKIAIIGDIHSNIFALKSVLKDIEKKEVDTIISTGDIVGYLTHPNQVINLMKKNNILSVKGNHDERIASKSPISKKELEEMDLKDIHKKGSLNYMRYIIDKDNLKWLKNLPNQIKMDFNGLKLMIVHGSPRKIDEYMYEDSKILEEFSKNIDSDIIISGHTHKPYHKKINHTHFINAGSVGKPKTGDPRANYIIIDIENEELTTEFINVTYNIDKIIEAIKLNEMIPNKLITNLSEGK